MQEGISETQGTGAGTQEPDIWNPQGTGTGEPDQWNPQGTGAGTPEPDQWNLQGTGATGSLESEDNTGGVRIERIQVDEIRVRLQEDSP